MFVKELFDIDEQLAYFYKIYERYPALLDKTFVKTVKTFDEYFQECIKNKTVPPDTPPYLKKALERDLKEYQQGIIKEKSALEDFAEKYTIDGEPGVTPIQYFKNKAPRTKYSFRSHRNIKVRFVLVSHGKPSY